MNIYPLLLIQSVPIPQSFIIKNSKRKTEIRENLQSIEHMERKSSFIF